MGTTNWPATPLTARLGITYPLIQAPMASISTAPLAAAISAAGGLGSLGTAVMTPAEVRVQVSELRARTDRPFAVNFFVHSPPVRDEQTIAEMTRRLEPHRSELGVTDSPSLDVAPPFGPEMLALVLELRPPVASFHFGLPEPPSMAALRSAGIKVLGSATTVAEAQWLERGGVDAVIAQGVEAGGHRGTFSSPFTDGELGTMALVPQVVAAVAVPVIATGGIADGRGITAALALGAAGAQLGTAFLRCPEAAIDPLYRRTLSEARVARTRLTRLWTGRPARAIVTRFMDEMATAENQVPAFPLQRGLMAPLAKAARAQGNPEFLPMWAGQAAALARPLPAAALFAELVQETVDGLRAMGA